MATIKDLTEDGVKHSCLFCGYNEYQICLTAHHLFPKYYFKPQPKFEREDRYLILCRHCHFLLHNGIFAGNGKQIINEKIDYCEIKYSNQKSTENIIKLARMVYETAYKQKPL